jgi:Glycerol-3-phosphate dehydrogenase
MNITVIGCGRWGTFLAWYLDKIGNSVTLYGRSTSKNMCELIENRSNGLIALREEITLETDLASAMKSEILVISVNSQGLRDLLKELSVYSLSEKKIILCMKGIEISTGKRLTEIVEEYTGEATHTAVWLGPGHVQELYTGVPNCMVIDSASIVLKSRFVEAFSSDLIRFYYGTDLIGNEIGGAAKNVIGIAAGMLDGLKLTSLKGALMSRGTREIARLIKAMGGNELSAYGLCHLGDYQATIFSEFSHNRRYGEACVTGENFTELAEGYYTVKALVKLGENYHVDLPICNAVYDVLYQSKDVKETLDRLFLRSLKQEF